MGRAIVNGYDPTTMTATITPYDGSGLIRNAVCQFSRYDPTNAAFSVTPPCIGAPCLYTQIGGETFILNTFPPMNINTEDNQNQSPLSAFQNRTPTEMSNNNTLPGNTSSTTSFGSEETLTDMTKKIIIVADKLSSIWNMLNCVWENICSIFRLRTAGVDVLCEVNEANETNTTINVRRTTGERTGVSVINLEMGTDADIITLKINDVEFLHIDAERNVTLTAKNIDVNALNINYNADEFNCLNVGAVKLP